MTDSESRIKGLLEANREIAKSWNAPPNMDMVRAGAHAAGGATAVLTCLDPRCVPEQYFGPKGMFAAYRNAGGRATKEAITSLTVLQALLGLSTVLVVHHTDCGTTHLTDDQIRQKAKEHNPDAAPEIDATESYGSIDPANFEEAIRQDVRTLQQAKVLAGVDIRGFALDTMTGVVTEVKDQ